VIVVGASAAIEHLIETSLARTIAERIGAPRRSGNSRPERRPRRGPRCAPAHPRPAAGERPGPSGSRRGSVGGASSSTLSATRSPFHDAGKPAKPVTAMIALADLIRGDPDTLGSTDMPGELRFRADRCRNRDGEFPPALLAVVAHSATVPASGGSTASTSVRRGSSQRGIFRAEPSSVASSSAVKPGPSVATSSRTPPGSRK
jgi:hypothetical protein